MYVLHNDRYQITKEGKQDKKKATPERVALITVKRVSDNYVLET